MALGVCVGRGVADGRRVAAAHGALFRYGQPLNPNWDVGAPSAEAETAIKAIARAHASRPMFFLMDCICTSLVLRVCCDIAISL